MGPIKPRWNEESVSIQERENWSWKKTYLDAIRLDSNEAVEKAVVSLVYPAKLGLSSSLCKTYVCSVVMFARVWSSMFLRRRALSLGPRCLKMGGSGIEEGWWGGGGGLSAMAGKYYCCLWWGVVRFGAGLGGVK